MPSRRLRRFLNDNNVRFVLIQHSPAYTAQQVAAEMHVHGWELAKTTILKMEGRFVMAVLSAPYVIDFGRMATISGARDIELATEPEFRDLFPECEVGAMPPFGNLYGLPVYVDTRLEENASIVFNAGTHDEAIRVTFADFKRLVDPVIGTFGVLARGRFRPHEHELLHGLP